MRHMTLSDEEGKGLKKGSAHAMTFILAVFILTAIVVIGSTGTETDADDSGECGDGVTWTYTVGTKTLSIGYTGSGTGQMASYSESTIPWKNYKTEFNTAIIGEGVTTIANAAFTDCSNLESISIPSSVTQFPTKSLDGCSSLESITVDPGNSKYSSDLQGILYNKDMSQVLRCPEKKGSVTIPSSVTNIFDDAFSNCTSLTSVTIPSSVTEMGRRAFSNCTSLKSISFSNVEYIVDETFFNCTSLESVTIPSSVTEIGWSAFEGCISLSSVTIPSSVTELGIQAFSGCTSLEFLTISSGVKIINQEAFKDCTSLSSVTIPSSVTELGSQAFSGCTSLSSVNIPSSVTEIKTGIFAGCTSLDAITVDSSNPNYSSDSQGILYNKSKTNLIQCPGKKISVSIPSGVTKINHYAFDGCSSLSSVTIPSSVTEIGEGAFYKCISLISITIPESVTEIEQYTFTDCDSLNTIYFNADKTNPNIKLWPIFNHILYVDANGGYVTGNGMDSGNKKFPSADAYAKEGLMFKEYNTKADGSGISYKPGDKFDDELGSLWVYAIWWDGQQFSVNIDSDDGIQKIQYMIGSKDYKDYSGPFDIDKGQKLTVRAQVKNGYKFIQWGAGITDNPYVIDSVTSNINLNAKTEPPIQKFNVTLGKDSGIQKIQYKIGSGSYTDYSGSFKIDKGQSLTVKATMKDGYTFVRWATGITDNPYTIDSVTNDISLSAVSESSIQKYTITLGKDSGIQKIQYKIGSGSYTDYSGSFKIDKGQSLTVKAMMKDGYTFVRWGIGITDNPYVIDDISSDVNLSAVSEPTVQKYTVKVRADPANGGSVYGSGDYEAGSNVTLSATSADGWKFIRWISDSVSIVNGKFVMPSEDVTVTAVFEKSESSEGISPVAIAAGAVVACIAIGAAVVFLRMRH